MNTKVLSLAAILKKVKLARRKKKTIVTTNGCFDILHVGHLRYLAEARKLGDLLIVGVNGDDSVKALKGPDRPINPARHRAELVAGLRAVDYVFIFKEKESIPFLNKIKPDIHVKGGDYSGKIIEQETVEANGGRVCLVSMVRGISTTDILKRIAKIP